MKAGFYGSMSQSGVIPFVTFRTLKYIGKFCVRNSSHNIHLMFLKLIQTSHLHTWLCMEVGFYSLTFWSAVTALCYFCFSLYIICLWTQLLIQFPCDFFETYAGFLPLYVVVHEGRVLWFNVSVGSYTLCNISYIEIYRKILCTQLLPQYPPDVLETYTDISPSYMVVHGGRVLQFDFLVSSYGPLLFLFFAIYYMYREFLSGQLLLHLI